MFQKNLNFQLSHPPKFSKLYYYIENFISLKLAFDRKGNSYYKLNILKNDLNILEIDVGEKPGMKNVEILFYTLTHNKLMNNAHSMLTTPKLTFKLLIISYLYYYFIIRYFIKI